MSEHVEANAEAGTYADHLSEATELIRGMRVRLGMPAESMAEVKKLRGDALIWLAHIERAVVAAKRAEMAVEQPNGE